MFSSLTKYFINAIFGAKNEHIKSLENERDYLRQENMELRQRIDFILRIPNLRSLGGIVSTPVPEQTNGVFGQERKTVPVGKSGIQSHRLGKELEGRMKSSGNGIASETQNHFKDILSELTADKFKRSEEEKESKEEIIQHAS